MKLTGTFLLTAVVLTIALFGCGSTGSVGAQYEQPVPGGGDVEVSFGVGWGGNTDAHVSGPPMCLEVCWSDSAGATINCVVIEVPGSTQVPSGAVRWSARPVECPKGLGGGGGGRMPAADQQSGDGYTSRRDQYVFLGGSVLPLEHETNLSYSFRVSASSATQARLRRDAVLAAGIGAPVGQGFQVTYWNEQTAEYDDLGLPLGVRMRQALQGGDFTSYELELGGAPYAELGGEGGLLHYGVDNGWDVVELFVPLADFDTSARFDNSARAEWTTDHTAEHWKASQRVHAE